MAARTELAIAAAADAVPEELSEDAVVLIQRVCQKTPPHCLQNAAKECFDSDFEDNKVDNFLKEVRSFLETTTFDVHFHARPKDSGDWKALCDALGPCLRVRSFGELVRDTSDWRLRNQNLSLSVRNGQERLRVCYDLLPGQDQCAVSVASVAKEYTAHSLHDLNLQTHAAMFAQRFYFAHDHVIDVVRLRAQKYYIVARLKAAHLTKLATHVQPAASRLSKTLAFASGAPKADDELDTTLPAALKAILEEQEARHAARQLKHQTSGSTRVVDKTPVSERLERLQTHLVPMLDKIRKAVPNQWIVYTGNETVDSLIDQAVSTERQAQQRACDSGQDALIVSTASQLPSGGDIALVECQDDTTYGNKRDFIRAKRELRARSSAAFEPWLTWGARHRCS
ncbi:uncharacterized protein MONBRDRAFT_10649 [Monosiga brevicollis MX1]|uniref:Uncharacterized protein n=1 Tax=Monosiga brevicollis TaxID=81824 RepID=A9V6J4_MONBE|nr:uncharacterized protein MONBRDRAFT_10649 [Monosiga brevicollis MX1]EDQ86895.1 predicted protein [Monosiga brevicollis MX1]|eukprot:XP_001748440.1 hypothetical protein [Monosiga brevicollis MX1]